MSVLGTDVDRYGGGEEDGDRRQDGVVKPTLTARQIQNGRAMLGWTVTRLSKRTGLRLEKLRRIEDGTDPLDQMTAGLIRSLLEKEGIEFISDERSVAGVRIQHR